jgi:hypothetical protein
MTQRRWTLPTVLTLLGGGLLLMSQGSDSPIVVADANSIHMRRPSGGSFQGAGGSVRVQDAGHRASTVEIFDAAPPTRITLAPGWAISLRDGGTEVGLWSSTDNTTLTFDPKGSAMSVAPSEVVLSTVHLRTVQVRAGATGAFETHTCPAGRDCLRIHY